jgi:hypothetical protein
MTHTPAPWKTLDGAIVSDAINDYGNFIVADIRRERTTQDEANLHLIAAAPDMLSALNNALQYVIAWRYEYASKPQDKHNNEQRDRIDATLRQMQEAIAKATNAG